MVIGNMKPSFILSVFKLLGVGAVFYSSYGLTNWLAAQRQPVPEIFFSWEVQIPFWSWTIVPYWTLNAFYALAFFLCHNTAQQNRYIAQLLLAQAIAVTCFLLFPLQFSWPKPPTEGLFGSLFQSLAAFDAPYNQAPSLHIILTLIVGRFYWYRLSKGWRACWLVWCILIGLSVLTTWQHHFIDVPTGLLVGALVLWALPWQQNEAAVSPLSSWRWNKQGVRWVIFYLALAALSVFLAAQGGAWLWLLWPAVSCALVAAAYAGGGAAFFQKQPKGRHSLAAGLLLWPNILGSRINRWAWLRGKALSSQVTERLFLGSQAATADFSATLDLCAELPNHYPSEYYISQPMLDMVPPSAQALRSAADSVQNLLNQHQGPVLVACALGYGRSAAVVLTWQLIYGGYRDLDAALQDLSALRPGLAVSEAARQNILEAVGKEE